MKLKHLSSLSMLIILGIIISSCAVNHEIERRLTGKWNPVNVENLAPEASQPPAMQTIKVDTSSDPDVKKETELTLPANKSEKQKKFERVMANEMRGQVMIAITDNQRIAEKYFPGKTVKGTWKLKRNGKRVAMKESETGRKFALDIVSLSDSTLVVREKLPVGDFRIKYSRVK